MKYLKCNKNLTANTRFSWQCNSDVYPQLMYLWDGSCIFFFSCCGTHNLTMRMSFNSRTYFNYQIVCLSFITCVCFCVKVNIGLLGATLLCFGLPLYLWLFSRRIDVSSRRESFTKQELELMWKRKKNELFCVVASPQVITHATKLNQFCQRMWNWVQERKHKKRKETSLDWPLKSKVEWRIRSSFRSLVWISGQI